MEKTSLIAQIVLGLWVPIAFGSFFVARPQQAALFTILGAELFLPELAAFKFPLMPPFDKHNLPYICVLIACMFRYPGRVFSIPKARWFVFLTLCLAAGGIMTGLTNADPVQRRFLEPLPGLSLKDGCYMAVNSVSRLAFPFFIGYSLFKKPADLRTLLAAFAVAGLIYTPFALWEGRMSPQLHLQLYGYYQDDFTDVRRWGGFRPMIFMPHGLAVARFFGAAALAPFVFSPTKRRFLGVSSRTIGWFLIAILILCKSTGAIVFALLALLLILFTSSKQQARIAAVLAVLVFLYPAVRMLDLMPTEKILTASAALAGLERSRSVEYRFTNENLLLARARERPAFGWGEYGRNFTFDRYGSSSTADGYWIIRFGETGTVGFIASFGLLLIPILLAKRGLRNLPGESERSLLAGAALLQAVLALDLIPNGLWGPYAYLIAGALTGVTGELARERAAEPAPQRLRDVGEDVQYA